MTARNSGRDDWFFIPGPGEFLLVLAMIFLIPAYIGYVLAKHPKSVLAALILVAITYFRLLRKIIVLDAFLLSVIGVPYFGRGAVLSIRQVYAGELSVTILLLALTVTGLSAGTAYLIYKYRRLLWGPPIIPRDLITGASES